MNAYIPAIIRARAIKFTGNVCFYFTQLKRILEFGHAPYETDSRAEIDMYVCMCAYISVILRSGPTKFVYDMSY